MDAEPNAAVDLTASSAPSVSDSDTSPTKRSPGDDEEFEAKRRLLDDVDPLHIDRNPGNRVQITSLDVNLREVTRRAYLLAGPLVCDTDGPRNTDGRRFFTEWSSKYPWIEYSTTKDAAFCFHCFIMVTTTRRQESAFVEVGFSRWDKVGGDACSFKRHEGSFGSQHHQNVQACIALLADKTHVDQLFLRQVSAEIARNRSRLEVAVHCARFLGKQALAFRGHDESEDSSNRGNYIELMQLLADHNATIAANVLSNAPDNNKYTSPDVQKDICRALAAEAVRKICDDIGNEKFCILVDESADVSGKEQMTIILRYVNAQGSIIERFLGVVHVQNTCAATLWAALQSILSECGLAIANIRGQGFDGASTMSGEFNGLKALILQANSSAYFVHCFAHQLQLALVATAKQHSVVWQLFSTLSSILNVAAASCKRKDQMSQSRADKLAEQLNEGVLETGKGQNQPICLKRTADTRWSSHYAAVINLLALFAETVEVLEDVSDEGSSEQRAVATGLLKSMLHFEFILGLFIVKSVLGIANDLCEALQRRDQDIVNAMRLVTITKARISELRLDGWQELLAEVTSFCQQHEIEVPDMNQFYRRRRKDMPAITYDQHYRIDLFYTVVDHQSTALNARFPELSTELLICANCFNPRDSYAAFNKDKLVRLAKFYPADFGPLAVSLLSNQLQNFIIDVRSHPELNDEKKVRSVAELSEALVRLHMHVTYALVYRLLKLVLTLPVSTASAERSFSAMKIVKESLRNRMSDSWLNDLLLIAIEKEMVESVPDDDVMFRYQSMCHESDSSPLPLHFN